VGQAAYASAAHVARGAKGASQTQGASPRKTHSRPRETPRKRRQ
jgi:hypothetical protein